MIRPIKIVLILAALLLPLAGCARPAPSATPHPDSTLLVGRWERFLPTESMPESIVLDSSGGVLAGGGSGQWKLAGDTLTIRSGGQETAYSFTVSGYMLSLFNRGTSTSCFYINPEAFSSAAGSNAELAGQWAAWSTYAKMDFDGGTRLDNIIYTTAGRTVISNTYAARDGILQTEDASGNYTYNLFSFGTDGALQLAETSDYDNDTKQWTQYWKATTPPQGLLGNWKQVISSQGGFPGQLALQSGGAGTAAMQGAAPAGIRWEYYPGGFVIIEYSEANLTYAWCSEQGGTLFLGNPDVDEAWYIDTSRFKPTAAPVAGLIGAWECEDGTIRLDFTKDNAVTARNQAGKATKLTALAADGLLQLGLGRSTYWAQYSVDGDTMRLTYGRLPFLEQQEMPVILNRVKP